MSSSPPGQSLSGTAARGGLQVVAGQWGRYVLQALSLIVLARMLAPSQYGLVGMILAIAGVAEVVRDFGLANAAMQAREIRPEQAAALFWLNVGLGALFTAIAIACAPVLAGFYHRPALTALTIGLAPVFLLNGASVQLQAGLSRDLAFARTAYADALSMAVGLGVGIAVAVRSPTAWALVGMQLSAAAARLLMLARARSLTLMRPRTAGLAPLLRFGRNITVVQLLDYASRNVDTVLVGRYWGATSVGLYNNAYQLLMLPLQQINGPLTRVALPVLARLRDDRRQMEDYLRSALLLMTTVAALIYGGLAAVGTDVVVVLFGPQWAGAGPIFQAMCVAGLLQAVRYVNYWIYMSLDRTATHLRYSLVAKPLVLVGFVIAAPHGVAAVAWSYTITTVLISPGDFVLACRGTGLRTRALVATALRPLPIGVALFGAMYTARLAVPSSSHLLGLLVAAGAGIAAAALLMVVPGVRALAWQIVGMVTSGSPRAAARVESARAIRLVRPRPVAGAS